MASTSATSESVQLNDDDIAYVMNLLRNATQPVTTQQLMDALRRQAANARATEDGDASDSR
jgi:predicted N-acetyltransferase YhbS